MLPRYPFTPDSAQLAVAVFALALAFFSGALGGYLYGLTHTARQGEALQRSKSIWTYDDED